MNRRWQLTEIAGVTLIAAALAFVHIALAIGAIGVYLLVVAVLQEIGGPGNTGGDA